MFKLAIALSSLKTVVYLGKTRVLRKFALFLYNSLNLGVA